jgi:cytochrome c-type biogenesis protein CcmH
MMNRRYTLLAILGLVMLFSLPLAAHAQGGSDDTAPVREITADEVNRVSSLLYCPVCENIPLDVCGTEACARWREQVRTLLEEGKSDDEVINYFVEQFGERVVGTPQDPMLAFFAQFVPIAFVVIGLGIVAVVFVRWRVGRTPSDEDELDALLDENDDYRMRLERELRNQE